MFLGTTKEGIEMSLETDQVVLKALDLLADSEMYAGILKNHE